MGAQDPKGLLAIHTNMPNAIPRAMDSAAFRGAPVPDGLSDDERQAYEQLAAFYRDPYYGFLMGTRPQTLTALTDSPVGLATFLIDHDRRSLELIARCFNGVPESGVKVPVAVSAFPDDLYQLPRTGRSWRTPS